MSSRRPHFAVLLQRLDQPRAVDRLDQRDERRDVLHLVGLKMTYHVPLDILGQHFVFCPQLLRAALAEEALPGVVGLPDGFDRVGLRDGDEPYPFGQRLPHAGQLFLYRHGCPFFMREQM